MTPAEGAAEGPRPAVELPDVNVLVALVWPSHVHHAVAQRWFAAREGGWATTPSTEMGLARLSMNPRVVGRVPGWPAVLQLLERLRALPGHVRWADSVDPLADPLVRRARIVGHRQVGDVLLVAHTAARSGRLVTLDDGLVEALAPQDREIVEVLEVT